MGHHTSRETDPVEIGGDEIEIVTDFTYLGSNITQEGQLQKELSARIAKASGHLAVCESLSLTIEPYLQTPKDASTRQ